MKIYNKRRDIHPIMISGLCRDWPFTTSTMHTPWLKKKILLVLLLAFRVHLISENTQNVILMNVKIANVSFVFGIVNNFICLVQQNRMSLKMMRYVLGKHSIIMKLVFIKQHKEGTQKLQTSSTMTWDRNWGSWLHTSFDLPAWFLKNRVKPGQFINNNNAHFLEGCLCTCECWIV